MLLELACQLSLQVGDIFIWTDCLRLFVVVYKLILLNDDMCLPAFFVTIVLIKPVMGIYMYTCIYIMLFTNILPEAICCCLETCNVCGGVDVVLHNYVYKLSWSLVLYNIIYYSLFINLLPEAICYCLQTCYVYGVLLTCAGGLRCLSCVCVSVMTFSATSFVSTLEYPGTYGYIIGVS